MASLTTQLQSKELFYFMCPMLSKWLELLLTGCKYEDFLTYSALKSHIYRIHREKDVNSGGEIEPTEEEEEIM